MGSSDSEKTEIRYASYIEDRHMQFLNDVHTYVQAVVSHDQSPFRNYENINIEDAFYTTGYVLSNYPTLYDMFGKFMSGLDIDILYKKYFKDMFSSDAMTDAVGAEGTMIDLNISGILLPEFLRTMRNLNAVVSSSFVIGRALIEEKRIKALAQFSAALKYPLLPFITAKWTAELNYKKTTLTLQAFILKFYYASKMYIDDINYDKIFRHLIWPLEVLSYERAALGAMRNMRSIKKQVKERSNISKGFLVASYTLQGAVVGSYWGPVGTLIGGVVGFFIGLAVMLFE